MDLKRRRKYVKRAGKFKGRWDLNDHHYCNYGGFSTCGKSHHDFLLMDL